MLDLNMNCASSASIISDLVAAFHIFSQTMTTFITSLPFLEQAQLQ